jgi:hypothetical protein
MLFMEVGAEIMVYMSLTHGTIRHPPSTCSKCMAKSIPLQLDLAKECEHPWVQGTYLNEHRKMPRWSTAKARAIKIPSGVIV